MKKIFTALAATMLIGVSSFSASAQITVQLGETFTLQSGEYAILTPNESGEMTMTTGGAIFSNPVYASQQDMTNDNPLTPTSGGSFGFENMDNRTWTYEVTSGNTYYISFGLNVIQSLIFTMGDYEIPTPEGDVNIGESFTVKQGEYHTYYSEKAGKLTGTISPAQVNTTEKATLLYTSWNSATNSGEGLVAYEKPATTPYTKQVWEVKANTLYYITGNEVITEATVTLSFEEDTTGGDQGGDSNNPDPSNWTLIPWDTQTTVVSGTTYYVVGQGDAAYIEVPRTNDYTIGDQLAMYWNGDLSDQIALTPALTPEGYYYYNIGFLQDGVNYTLVSEVFGSSGIPVTFKSGNYVAAAQEIGLGENQDFNAQQVYAFTATESGVVEFTTQTSATEIENSIWFTDENHENALTVKNVEGSANYAVTFEVTEGETYYLYFTYPNYIVATLAMSQTEPNPDYMSSLPTFYYDADPAMPTVILYWNETIQPIDENTALQGTLTSPGGAEIPVTLAITTWYPEADNDPNNAGGSSLASNNALIASLAQILPVYGVGTYTFSIGSIVMNEAGEWNMPVENEQFTVEAGPSITEIEPTFSISGDSIIINWDEETVEVYNPNDADIIILYGGENPVENDEYRLSLGNGVSIVDNSVVIDLTALDLVEGEPYTLIIPEYYFYVGGTSTVNGDIIEEFIADSTGVNVIGSANGKEVIYNLNGVRVDANKLSKGIYIINGKKVMVK